MHLILFLILIIAEILYRIDFPFFKQQKKIIHLFIKVFVLLILIILFLFSILTFGIKYILILIYLLSSITLLALHIKNNRSVNIGIKKLILNLLFIFIIFTPVFIFPEYRPLKPTGAYEVEKVSFTLTDLNRLETMTNHYKNRKISIDLYHPNDLNQIYPLIIFSPGGISTKTSNESLYLNLASHGYVVISIDHTFHSLVSKIEGKNYWINPIYMNELNKENATLNKENSLALYQKWMTLRTEDINFVIEHILLAQTYGIVQLFNIIDMTKIGLMGHSLGGSAAICSGQENPLIQAVMALESPMLCSILDVVSETFVIDDTNYPIPLFHIYSDSAFNRLSELPQYKKNDLLLNTNLEDIFYLHISGSAHFSLTDLSLLSPFLTTVLNGFQTEKDSKEILEIINETALNFFNTYLKNNEG
jgi:hypothetical protein